MHSLMPCTACTRQQALLLLPAQEVYIVTDLQHMPAAQLVNSGWYCAVSMHAYTQLALPAPAPCINHTALFALLFQQTRKHPQQSQEA